MDYDTFPSNLCLMASLGTYVGPCILISRHLHHGEKADLTYPGALQAMHAVMRQGKRRDGRTFTTFVGVQRNAVVEMSALLMEDDCM